MKRVVECEIPKMSQWKQLYKDERYVDARLQSSDSSPFQIRTVSLPSSTI
ncbi:hypothetical protein SESBI_04943 [Sesbania bispinosa]|nr:hypothetical protein SESBI_04943 [Sesbania bispinosa]